MRISDWSSDVCSSDLCGSIAFMARVCTGLRRQRPAPGGPGGGGRKLPALRMDRLPRWGCKPGGLAASMAATSSPPLEQARRSEEHTSELQSLMRISYAVFCLKKKKTTPQQRTTTT